jgi:oligogalacturonide lyase
MATLTAGVLGIGLLEQAAGAATALGETNDNAQTLRNDWVDADTGHAVTRLSRLPGQSESFYFHQNAFTESGDKFAFANTGTGRSRDLYVLDWKTHETQRLTDGGANHGEVVGRKTRQVFYLRDDVVYSASLDTGKRKEIARLAKGWGGLTVNADETVLAGSFGEGAAEITRGKPRSYWFEALHAARLPHFLFTIDIASGRTNIFLKGNDWFNHVQFSPTDPQLLLFCHEGPWHLVDRIWNVRTDGTGLQLLHKRTVTNEIAGHEFWSADGKTVWFDLQKPRGKNFFLAGTEPGSGRETQYAIARDQWSVHFNISRDGKHFAGDGGAANMVAHAENGKWIWLFTPQANGQLEAERLVNMAKHDYGLEPNVNFSPDGQWIIFRGNFDGSRQVYAVEVRRRTPAGQRSDEAKKE